MIPENKVPGANMRPTWDLSAPDGPHVGPRYLALRDIARPSFVYANGPILHRFLSAGDSVLETTAFQIRVHYLFNVRKGNPSTRSYNFHIKTGPSLSCGWISGFRDISNNEDCRLVDILAWRVYINIYVSRSRRLRGNASSNYRSRGYS